MTDWSLAPLAQGFGVSAALIIAIGAQNAFVLQQGLRRSYLFVSALTCALCDAVLISLGVGGFGAVIASTPWLTLLATWGGALFLLLYGWRSFRSAMQSNSLSVQGELAALSLRATVLGLLAVSLLNPHALLDTVVLIGSVGAQYPAQQRAAFALGAMLASLTWFFSLAYGAARLAPLFQKPLAWRVLDLCVGCLMWGIAASLIRTGLHGLVV
ncbi:MAG: amino acid transporter [Anaerolineae bacterium]|nr:amino acid transporter [Anaerolineae bacterium]